MEMEFKYAGRRRRLLLIVVGVLLAVGAGWASLMLASSNNHPAAPAQTQSVLVAARDIPARATLTADDVAIRTVAANEVLPQSYTDPNEVIGRVSAVPVYTDQQMTPNLFATSDANSDFSILGPDETVSPDSPAWRAIALQVSPQQAVGGDIQAGDHVDVIVSVQFKLLTQGPDGTYVTVDTATADGLMGGTSTKISMQDLEVLKVDPDSNVYTLKVTLSQAEQIAQVYQEAPNSFTIVLRPGDDTRPVDPSQYGVTDDRLILTYLYPVPQLYDPHLLLNPPTPVPGSSTPPVLTPAPSTSPESGSAEPSASAAP